MLWIVLWGARAAPESLEVHSILYISMVWVVLWGARVAPDSLKCIEFYTFPWFGLCFGDWGARVAQ